MTILQENQRTSPDGKRGLSTIFHKVFGKSLACFCLRETALMRLARAGWIRTSLIVNGSIYPCLRLSVKQPFVSRRLFCLWKLPGNKSWWRLYLAIMRSIFISLSLTMATMSLRRSIRSLWLANIDELFGRRGIDGFLNISETHNDKKVDLKKNATKNIIAGPVTLSILVQKVENLKSWQ